MNRRWGIAAAIVAGAVLVHFVGLIVFHAEPVGSEERKVEIADVSLMPIGGGEATSLALREQALLRDSTPLFLPTQWNAVAEPAVRGLGRRPGDLFPAYAPELSLENVEIGESRIEEAPQPLDGVRHFDASLFHAFRPAPPKLPYPTERSAHFQVVSPETGEEAFSMSLDESLPVGGQLWAPATFGVQISSIGLMGAPVLLDSSGIEELDTFFNRQLREAVFARQLPDPGYYRVIVGP